MIVLAALFFALQDGTVTLEKTAPIGTLLRDLQQATGGRFQIAPSITDTPVALKVRNASFFETLDAICRAHGNATYADTAFAGPDGTISLRSATWVEYPVVYSGPFRVTVSEMGRFTQTSSLGSRAWTRVYVVVFGPPWIQVSSQSGAKAEFTALEARTADGDGVLPNPEELDPIQRIDVMNYSTLGTKTGSNSVYKVFQLRPFDLDRGLSVFRGKAVLTVADPVDTAVAPKEGTQVQTEAGTLVVDKVTEHLKSDKGSTWRLQLTMQPKQPGRALRTLLENRVQEGEGKWQDLELPRDNGMTFEAVIGPLPKLPDRLVFRVRKGDRKVEVPFEFKNLTFKKG